MREFIFLTAEEIAAQLGARIRQLRLRGNLTQLQLAEMTGSSVSSIHRLESSGQGTIELLVRAAQAFQRSEEFDALFVPPAPSIAELERLAQAPLRKRARPPRSASQRKPGP